MANLTIWPPYPTDKESVGYVAGWASELVGSGGYERFLSFMETQKTNLGIAVCCL
jgi:hypothetical protein